MTLCVHHTVQLTTRGVKRRQATVWSYHRLRWALTASVLSTAERQKPYLAFSKRRVFIQKAEYVSAICVGSLYRAKQSQHFSTTPQTPSCEECQPRVRPAGMRMPPYQSYNHDDNAYWRVCEAKRCPSPSQGLCDTASGLANGIAGYTHRHLATLILMLCTLGVYKMRKRHRKRSSSFGAEQESPHRNSAISWVRERQGGHGDLRLSDEW